MPNSLRVKFNNMRYKGRIDEAEYQALIKKLDGHDSELLDKVAERIKSSCDMQDLYLPIHFIEIIEDMKDEVSK